MTELKPQQHEALIQAAWTILTQKAKERETIKLANFESHVQASSGVTVDWSRSHVIRQACNSRSIKEKHCVIEAIIVKEDNTPDNRAFQMAWESRVYNLPEEETGLNFNRVEVTKKLQQQVFNAFINESNNA